MLLIEHRINTASIYNLLWKVSYRYLWDNMLIMTKKVSITKNFPLEILWKDLHNIFNIIGKVRGALRRNGRSDLIKEFTDYITSSSSYEEALCRVMEYVIVKQGTELCVQ